MHWSLVVVLYLMPTMEPVWNEIVGIVKSEFSYILIHV